MNAEAIVSAIRAVIRGELGSVHTVPPGAWREGVPAQFGRHGGLDGDTARRLRAEGKRLFDVEVIPARRTVAAGPVTASCSVLSFGARITLWLPITLVADTVTADHRYRARADALEQAQVIREALEQPGNLSRDADGRETGIVSGKLSEAQMPRIVREDWSVGLYEIELRLDGSVLRMGATPPPPTFTRLPSIHVADAAEPVVGGSLIADPGEVTGAYEERGQWLRDGAEIEGETGTVYAIVEADEGAELAYRATAIGSGGTVSETTPGIVVGAGVPLPDGFPIPDPGLLLIAGHGHAGAAPGEPIRTWDDYGATHCRFGAELERSRPTLEVVPAMGGLPAVKFRESDQTTLTCVSRESLRGVYYPATGATLFAAFHNQSYTSGRETILDAANLATTAPNVVLSVRAFAGGTLDVAVGSSSGAIINEAISGIAPGVPHFVVIRLQMDASPNWEIRVDGVVRASGDFAAPPTDAPTPNHTRLGGRAITTGSYLDGHLGTLGHIPRRLEDAELTELVTWLARYTA